VAASFGVELTRLSVLDAVEIEHSVEAFARAAHGGLIVTRTAEVIAKRDLIIALAARHRLPAVYPLRFFATAGGLISYGSDIVDRSRRAAAYVDRIFKGEKPADLPSAGADQVRDGHQSENRQGARARPAADGSRPRRRGD